MLEDKVQRPLGQRLLRKLLLNVLPHRKRFSSLLNVARIIKPILPRHWRDQLPDRQIEEPFPKIQHQRHVLLIEGCVQPALAPQIDLATARVLDQLGISSQRTHIAQCCGAIEHHGHAKDAALNRLRSNIDLWLPYLEQGAEAIISSASACTLQIKEYAYLLRNDAEYAEKAARISAACRDISECIAAEDLTVLNSNRDNSVAFHASCSLQHGQQINGVVEDILQRVGYKLCPVAEPHLCCGSAGTYAILEAELSTSLRDNKLTALTKAQPDIIASANIGCLNHLAAGSNHNIRHWIELLPS